MPDHRLSRQRASIGSDHWHTLIRYLIQHPLCHLGDINHIRALLQGNDDRNQEGMEPDEPC